jgi:hypothetical protein
MTTSNARTAARATRQAAARKKLDGARGATAAKKVATPAATAAAKKVAKPAAKKAAKKVAKRATPRPAKSPARRTPPATTTRAPKPSRAATPAPAAPAKASAATPGDAKPPKPPKPDRVRDKFSLPAADYALIDKLKLSARRNGLKAKKNDLLRLGLQALDALSSSELQDRLLMLRVHDKRSAKQPSG